MARGNSIIVSTEASVIGPLTEGYAKTGETPSPGVCVVKDPTVALKHGRHTYKLYAPGTDGEMPAGAKWIVTEDTKLGRTMNDAYAAGEIMRLYCPYAGNEMNLLLADVAGTGDDHSAGEKLILDTGTGRFIATTGTPEEEVALLLEAVTDPTAATLAWAEWGGN